LTNENLIEEFLMHMSA